MTSLIAAVSQEERDTAAAASAKSAGSTKDAVKVLADELADKAKTKANNRAGALCGLRALLEALADKAKPVMLEATSLCMALVEAVSPNAVDMCLPSILAEAGGKWRCNLGRVQMLSSLAKRCPTQVALQLTAIIPVVSDLMGETKLQVADEAGTTMVAVFATMTNRDLTEFLPGVIACIKKPELVPE